LFKTATAAPANPNSLSLFQSARFSAYWCVCVSVCVCMLTHLWRYCCESHIRLHRYLLRSF
jgi:hypothetical protein